VIYNPVNVPVWIVCCGDLPACERVWYSFWPAGSWPGVMVRLPACFAFSRRSRRWSGVGFTHEPTRIGRPPLSLSRPCSSRPVSSPLRLTIPRSRPAAGPEATANGRFTPEDGTPHRRKNTRQALLRANLEANLEASWKQSALPQPRRRPQGTKLGPLCLCPKESLAT